MNLTLGPRWLRVSMSYNHGPGVGFGALGWHAALGWDSRPDAHAPRPPPPGCTIRALVWRGLALSWGRRDWRAAGRFLLRVTW